MQELSLHILDIVQNSIRAGATRIEIMVQESLDENQFIISVKDNGSGIDEKIKSNLTDPFTTTRTLRKVGLGLPFLKQLCVECEGELNIESELGKGTCVTAMMKHKHIDRLPLGAMEETMVTLIMAKPNIHYRYTHLYEKHSFVFDTEEIKQILDNVPIDNPEIIAWIKEYIKEAEKSLLLTII